jgi:ribosomal-protein-alanine N-acetyltransferase
VELATAVRIRALRAADTQFVSSLANAAFSEFSPEPARSTLWMAEHFVTLVAERGKLQLGFVVVRIERDRLAELVAIAVLETERGRGVGSALLRAAEIRARAGGATGVALHTADANVAALELFLKRGFRIRRRLRRYYVRVFDACELIKKW